MNKESPSFSPTLFLSSSSTSTASSNSSSVSHTDLVVPGRKSPTQVNLHIPTTSASSASSSTAPSSSSATDTADFASTMEGKADQTIVSIKTQSLLAEEPKKPKPLWPANNRFCCGNWFIYGPPTDNGPLICGWVSLLGAAAIFWGCLCPYLWDQISPAVPIIGTFFLLVDVYVYFRAAFADPGIIPRLNIQNELNLYHNGLADERIQKINSEKLAGDIYYPNEPLTQVNATLAECTTCKILRPHLSSHCRYCDNCVEGFDHHCNWIGNCVGQRNHRYFVGFVITTTVCCFWLCASGIVYLVSKAQHSEITASVQDIFAFILVAALGILFFFMFNVSSWQLELVMCGQTLKMRDRNGIKRTPIKKAFINLFRFFKDYKPRTAYFNTTDVRYIPPPACTC